MVFIEGARDLKLSEDSWEMLRKWRETVKVDERGWTEDWYDGEPQDSDDEEEASRTSSQERAFQGWMNGDHGVGGPDDFFLGGFDDDGIPISASVFDSFETDHEYGEMEGNEGQGSGSIGGGGYY